MPDQPKLLGLDIETAPATAYIWRMWDENISQDQLISPSRIICWGAKWFGQRPVLYADERGGRAKMMRLLHDTMSKADAIVTYNGDKFDLPKINGEFVASGLRPLPPIPSIDLIKTVRKLGLQSSRLAFVAPFLKIGAKVDSGGFRLWRECLEGNAAAWARMRKYNEMDVRLLEKLYRKLQPFIRQHPALFIGATQSATCGCPRCGSGMVQARGYRVTKAFRIERRQCQKCGGWSDGKRTAIKP